MFDLWSQSSAIRWQDFVDIALNSYILFRLYVLFRGTYVFRVITGIAFLWFFQRVAVSLGLIVTSWAMQGITAAAALIIVIVFRNEIRSVLQAKNLKAILWGVSFKLKPAPVETLVDAVFELARKRIGALIVIPAKEDPSDVAQGGIVLDGVVSRELILSVFWPDNPVHDGAAIIEGDRITQVGVILPLSSRTDLPSAYGTRHRAAAGLAESTDALVLVVSEESGKVVAARGNQVVIVPTRAELERQLNEHMGIGIQPVSYQRRRIFQLAAAGVISVLLITGVWFSFTRGWDTLISFEVPIEYMNRDPEKEILETSINNVALQLSGSGALIKSLRPDQVRVRLDLSQAVVGLNTFSITPDNIKLPPGVFLKDVYPQTVDVTLDIPKTVSLPVQVDWGGKLPEHLILVSAELEPDTLQVTGGSRLLDDISTIYTEKVMLDQIDRSGTLTVNPILSPASLKIAGNSNQKIFVRYTVKLRRP